MDFIEIQKLGFHYKKRAPIFENVTFKLKNGIYGLLGENGVGKTTLLHIICGLRFPKSGKCEVLGYESRQRNTNMLSKIFFLPEEFKTPTISISDYAKYNSPFYPNFSQEQFDEYLQEFHIDKDSKMSQQSFGQKKKAMIAFALAVNTPILLLDEPTNSLDIPSKQQFRRVISSIADSDRCIIISTHQVRDLEHLIDPIIILDNNQILVNNSVEEITNKLLFSYTPTKPNDTLYSEQMLQGYSSVSINDKNEESILNIETLFNTVISNKKTIKDLFNN